MSDGDPHPSPAPGLFVPFVILAASILTYLVWQVSNVQAQRSGLQVNKSKLAEAIQQREPQVAQSVELKTRLEALAIDLLELAKTDEKAMVIVKKFDIQRALPAAAAAAQP